VAERGRLLSGTSLQKWTLSASGAGMFSFDPKPTLRLELSEFANPNKYD